jgi:LCP family protein required for cell wall assembly
MTRLILYVILITLTVAGCARTTPATTTTQPVTTTTAPTTTEPATTTTTLPSVEISIDGAPAELTAAVQQAYLAAHTATPSTANLPDGLAQAFGALKPGTGVLHISGNAVTGTILDADIAVVTAGDDVVLAVADPTWRVVGMKPARFGLPAFYGPEPRLLFVVGTDARPGQDPLRSRGDSLHVVAMNPSTGEGAIVGIPRDSWVTSPSGASDKFTHILSRKGVDELLATAREVTSLPIEGYVLTGFEGFTSLVDSLGGFLLDVPFRMADSASQAYFQPGEQQIDGPKALAFSRDRHLSGGDFTRSKDQGLVMVAALAAIQVLGYDHLPALLETLTANTSTDLDAAGLLTMAASALELDLASTPNVVVKGSYGTENGASIVRLIDASYATFADLADGVLEQP